MEENNRYGRGVNSDIGEIQMKVYPNNEFDKMIRYGRFRVINHKYYSYLNVFPLLKPNPYQPIAATNVLPNPNEGVRDLPEDEYNNSSFEPNVKASAEADIIDAAVEKAMEAEAFIAFAEAVMETEAFNAYAASASETEIISADTEPAAEAETYAPDTEPAAEAETYAADAEPAAEAETYAPDAEPAAEAETYAAHTEPAAEAETYAPDAEPAAETEIIAVNAEIAVETEAFDVNADLSAEVETCDASTEIRSESEVNQTASELQVLTASDLEMNIAEFVDWGATQGTSSDESGSNPPPYINFIVFNRLGLTIKNLTNLLDSDEDFELNIIDCNSKDNSWDYIQSLTDSRIKSKIRFKKNLGPIYAANFALSRRKPNQYFITIDSDTFIKTKNWIARFMEVFDAFPDVGLLGVMRDNPYPRYLPPILPRANGAVSFLELKNADINAQMDFVPGQLQCLSPSLMNEVGYWSEENGFGDAELSPRIVHYTNFKVGFITTIEIDMTQKIPCSECMARNICTLSRSINDCFSLCKKLNKNESFVEKNTWKFKQTFLELEEGKQTAYCASIHDPESVKNHVYNAEWAYDNFNHYFINAN